MPKGKARLIHVDGAEIGFDRVLSRSEIKKLIGAPDALDIVNLRDGHVMMVDDTGMSDGRPVNPKATKLYHGVCRPGTVHRIHGDVVIVWEGDY